MSGFSAAGLAAVRHLFADGGQLWGNPSPVGAWAWCGVSAAGVSLVGASGVLLPTAPDQSITNNQAEFVAAVTGLLAMPPGWNGQVWLDSQITLNRLFHSAPLTNIPPYWVKQGGRALARLGSVTAHHVKGHPSDPDLAEGANLRGQVVSAYNVWCDSACRREVQAYAALHGLVKPPPGPRRVVSPPRTWDHGAHGG